MWPDYMLHRMKLRVPSAVTGDAGESWVEYEKVFTPSERAMLIADFDNWLRYNDPHFIVSITHVPDTEKSFHIHYKRLE